MMKSLIKWLHLNETIFRQKIIIKSLFYNHYLSWTYVGDTLLEPILWFVENFTAFLGPVFVVMISFLTALMVFIAYYIGLPYWWNKSPEFTIILLVLGNWILINVCFNYYMGITVPAGNPPVGGLIPEAVSICKKCIKPKPPRTHHCSVCNKCILKMDHHCPWFNNCVGHYNHRYFFQYMAFTVLGTVFVMVFGVQLAYEEFFLSSEPDLGGHPVRISNSEIIPLTESFDHLSQEEREEISREAAEQRESETRRKLIIFAAMLIVATFISLGALTWWHAGLISRGETSIEGRINASLEKKFSEKGKVYKNPYDFGRKQNWKLFLGLQNKTWRFVLFPSTHGPLGDGLTWETANDGKFS